MKKIIILILLAMLFITSACEKKSKATGIIDCKVGMKLRKGPSMSTQQIGYIPNRAQIKIFDLNGPKETLYNTDSKWLRVEYAGVKGWMFGGFVKIFKKDDEKLQANKIKAVIDAKTGMKLRQGPSIKTAQINYIPNMKIISILNKNGPEETIYGIKSRWLKVRYDKSEGWVFGGFVKILNKNDKEKKKESSTENALMRQSVNELNSPVVLHCIKELLKSYHEQDKKIIALSSCKNPQLNSLNKTRLINTIITNQLIKDSRFIISERKNLKKIVQEHSLQQSGLTTKTIESGKIAGAQLLLIYDLKDGILDFRIVDTNNAHVLAFSGINLFE